MNSIECQPVGRRAALWVALLVFFTVPVFIWYVWYPTAGYNGRTLFLATCLPPLAALILLTWLRWPLARIGLGLKRLPVALGLIALAYGLVLLIGVVANTFFAAGLDLIRTAYPWKVFVSEWLVTGLGEELMMCGVLFPLLANRLPRFKRWQIVLAAALIFALWHLPGYLAQHRQTANLGFSLLRNLASWIFFGGIFAVSGNLWLAAFAHASTDFALTPVILEQPLLGLVFFCFLLAAASLMARRSPRKWPMTIPAEGD
jgi:membrane protease YdiL (CAAX protease family)